MPKKRCTPEEIIQHLQTVELETDKGLPVLDACRKLGIIERTYYRWKKEYGGWRGSGQTPEELGARKHPAQTDRSRSAVDLKVGCLGKFLSPARRREAVRQVIRVLRLSERRACRAIGQVRSSPVIGMCLSRIRVRCGCGNGILRWHKSTGGMATSLEALRVYCGSLSDLQRPSSGCAMTVRSLHVAMGTASAFSSVYLESEVQRLNQPLETQLVIHACEWFTLRENDGGIAAVTQDQHRHAGLEFAGESLKVPNIFDRFAIGVTDNISGA